MDYETLEILYKSRQTLLKILAGRGYNTSPYEKFGPVEIGAMAAAGAQAFRMDLERKATGDDEAAAAAPVQGRITKCRVLYSFQRVKGRLATYISEVADEDAGDDTLDPATTEVIVVLLESVGDAFHVAALTALASPRKLHISFFQAHQIVNNPLEHVDQPRFRRIPPSEHAEFVRKNRMKSKLNMPQIKFHEDMAARVLGLVPGDIVEIIRPSSQAGEYIGHRVCVP